MIEPEAMEQNDCTPLFSRRCAIRTVPVSAEIVENTRKNQALILRGISDIWQGNVGAELGVHGSRVCRWQDDGTIERTAKLLAVIGYKLVPNEAKVYLEFE